MVAARASDTKTSAGLSDSEQNADTVIPTGPAAVTIVTPLGQRARAARKSSGLTSFGADTNVMLTTEAATSLARPESTAVRWTAYARPLLTSPPHRS